MRILMGRQTDERTAGEIEDGLNLREKFKSELREDIDGLNNAQMDRLDRLRDFIREGLVDVRVRDPEQGYFHAKGRASVQYPTNRVSATATPTSDRQPPSSGRRTSHTAGTGTTSN